MLRSFSVKMPTFEVSGASGSCLSSNSPSGLKRFRQHVNPLSMVYRQPVEIPNWTQCFADTSLPIHLDIGCARGKYLMDVAMSQATERNFVGVEIRRNVLQEAEREAEQRGLKNLAFVHANMNIHQIKLLQSLPAPVTSVSIFHPDPWMKKRHIKRRLVTQEFVEEMARQLANGTPIFVQTDVEELFAYMVEIFEMSRLYDFAAHYENPLGIPTDREKFVSKEGGDIFRVKFIVDKPAKEAEKTGTKTPLLAGDWALWQMVDSLYPTGGFAHSLGLEAAMQEGLVTASSLREFVSTSLHQSANFALPFVFSSHQIATSDSECVESVLSLNRRATAVYSNHVARKASFAQGSALVRLALSTYASSCPRIPTLLAIQKEAKKRDHGGVHHAVIFGVVCALLGIDVGSTQRMYLFMTTRDVLSAATRLNLVGPLEAAKVQFDMTPLLEKVFLAKMNREVEDSYSSAPVLDLVQAMHDQLYTRIFNS
ncbi:unnamed protein product [Peronospora effusa]|nr:unnamed protein product [Peronospora effusa]